MQHRMLNGIIGIIVLVYSEIGFLPPIFISTGNFTKQIIFKLGALFFILGKTPTNGS